jgi:hypothetical protein
MSLKPVDLTPIPEDTVRFNITPQRLGSISFALGHGGLDAHEKKHGSHHSFR